MIKKAQIKFIAVTTSILFFIFFVIGLVANNTLQNTHNKNIDNTINDTIHAYETNQEHAETNILILQVFPNEFKLVSCDEETFNEKEINKIYNDAIKNPNNFGKTDNFYYKKTIIKNDKLIVAFNASANVIILRSMRNKMIIALLIILAILFVIVYIMSFKIFQPIKDAFIKQKQFISNASHELKTPLSIISANTDVLMQTETENKWLHNVKNQTQRLGLIINDMLEMAKMDENLPILVKEDFDLSEEIVGSSLPFDAVAFEKGKTLILDVQPNVKYKGDRQSVKKIINIVLDNAVKYANDDGVIKVSLVKKNNKITLSVFNTGSAVPESYANKVFERFYRIDNSRSRESGGSGLGLSIAKAIADANKWKISAVSRLDEYMIINVVF